MAQLTADLITRLREDRSPEVRRETATLLADEFNKPDLPPTEQRLAEAIFRIMVRDTDVAVRQALAERLIAAVSETIRQRMAGITGLSPAITDQLVARGQETMTLEIAPPDERQAHLERLVRHLDVQDRLTPHLIMRALCTGHLAFFETAAAQRAGIEADKAHALIASGNEKGAAALCKAAKLPRIAVDVVVSATKIYTGIDDPNSPEGRLAFQAELIESCRPRYPDLIAGKPETLITKLAPVPIGS